MVGGFCVLAKAEDIRFHIAEGTTCTVHFMHDEMNALYMGCGNTGTQRRLLFFFPKSKCRLADF